MRCPIRLASLLLVFAIMACVTAGCDPKDVGLPAVIPTPPKAVNAAIDPNDFMWQGPDRMVGGDTVVIARCRGADEYAVTSARKNWLNHWYLVTMDVLAVDRGTWTDKEVNLVYLDVWPTPESGIMVKKPPFPFGPGYVFALALKTSEKPATLVASERRSYVAPYGPLKHYPLIGGKVEPESEFGRILKAVADFEANHKIPAQKAVTEGPEDVGDAWIVHRRSGWGTAAESWLYRVDKKTMTVQAIP
jgi:hypothetical protein